MSLLSRNRSLKGQDHREIGGVRFSSFWDGMSKSIQGIQIFPSTEDPFLKDGAALKSDWMRVGDDMRFAYRIFDKLYEHELKDARQKALFDRDDYKAK